jgi:prolyl-tRNA editing enzyme YbaK/EbsC (Cys-tRNA(Pro) deacylase)
MANLKQIEKYLLQQKLPFKLIDLSKEAYTVADVVDAGIERDEVVKTLIVRVGDGSFVAVALRGHDRVDFRKARKLFGSKTELAKPEEVLRVVGVPIGAVCPVLVGIPLYIDQNVLKLTNVHMGSGDLMHGLEMKLEDLMKAIREYKVEELI